MYLFALLSICLAFVISIHGAPQFSSESDFVSEDDVLRKNIANNIRILGNLTNDNDFAVAILKSIDQKCMLKKYKKSKLENELTHEALDMLNIADKPVDPLLIFANIALTCSNKLNALLGFAFDNAFSFSGLLDAFREDEPFKELIDDMVCYNNYAVKTNLVNPSEYQHLNYKLVNDTEAECEETVNSTRESLVEAVAFVAEFVIVNQQNCIQKEISLEAEKFFLKYALLIPLGLTEDQKKRERVNFIADAFEGLENLLACNIKVENKDNEIPFY